MEFVKVFSVEIQGLKFCKLWGRVGKMCLADKRKK